MSLAWYDRTLWRVIAYVPQRNLGLSQLSENEADSLAGRKLMDKLGPKPFAMPDEDLSEAVLHWPLFPAHWGASRFSDGQSYGLLYAALERETAIAEAHHYYAEFFADAGIPLPSAPRQLRGVFTFRVEEMLADIRKAAKKQRQLMANDHVWCRVFGEFLASHLQSGWAYRSVRRENGSAIALMRSDHASAVQWMETIELGGG